MSGKDEEKIDKGIQWAPKSSISSSLSISGSENRDGFDVCSVISDWSQTEEDDYPESGVGQLMHTLFRKQLYTDVTFYSKGSKDAFSAHRTVLAAKCHFFAELLFGNRTKESEAMQMKVEINNLPLNIFKSIVEYFYTGEIDLEDVSTVLDIFFGAKAFHVQSLVEQCESCIESLELNEDNVCSILQQCKDRDVEDLENRCISYIRENSEKVTKSVAFEKCNYSTVYDLCSLPSLNLNSEGELLEAVVRWVLAQPPDTQPQLMESLLPSIRFLTFSAPELGSILQKYSNIMAADDALKIMIFLNDSPEARKLQNLPPWCSRNREGRCIKQGNMHSAVKGLDLKTLGTGKILILLKTAAESRKITEQSSLLHIECLKGTHRINAVKFVFHRLPLYESVLIIVSVKVIQQTAILLSFQKHFVNLFREKVFKFTRGIEVHEGQIVDIKVKTKSLKPFGLFQLREKQNYLQSDYFKCRVLCRPPDRKEFIMSEVQYDL